ncbi:hypothetical protein Rpal_3080 [Rhodopseudomonas palustris TIE-1]|uniref:hypothetical protein n=1 Tax=Rhodopseudomonas palustris TaxID=1076 RepID=UPI000164A861|nr:hypothetical protein [Rhodopseudomonas palustris]ACF01586.1 hypothetical protein Rpal_3080 [Rhodopseudomonas palustris TIE-1]
MSSVDPTTIAAVAFAVNFIVYIAGGVWAVASIKADLAKQISDEREETLKAIGGLELKFLADQKKQDHNFGEVGAAMRQYIANVEKEMHAIEIWGRDNFVLKTEFSKATDSIRDDIKTMGDDIKTDIRALFSKVAQRPT